MEVRRRRPVAGQCGVHLGERGESGPRAVGLAHRHGPVEAYDGAAGQRQQLVVPLDDLHPVGLRGRGCAGVEGGDRRLQLELATTLLGQRGLQDRDALCDQVAVPQAALLLGERHEGAVRAGAGRAPGVVQQHQGEQAVGLRVRPERRELAGQPDRLRGQVHVAGVALVEDQVEHPTDGVEVPRPVERLPRHGALRPADPLRHRRLGHEVGRSDLARGQARHRAEREGDGGGGRQCRVGAEEEDPQRVVGVLGGPDAGLGVDRDLAPPAGGLGPYDVEEPPPRDRHQPALRVARGARLGEGAHRLDQGFLDGVLGRREVGSTTDENADHRGDDLPQRNLVEGVHQGMLSPAWLTGRRRRGGPRATRGSACRRRRVPGTARRRARRPGPTRPRR